MKIITTFSGIFILMFLMSCNNGSSKKMLDNNNDSKKLQATQLNENSNSGNEKKSNDSIAELLNQLKNIPTGENYIMVGALKTDILKYTSMGFGDLLHLVFIDKNNKEYDFNGNISKVELFKENANSSEENGGYEADKKYLNKNFRVVWRTVKLKNKPKNEIEMYYEEYDEIIYLKQIN